MILAYPHFRKPPFSFMDQVDVILKLYGFNGNFDVDRLMSGSQIWEFSGSQLLWTMPCRETAQRWFRRYGDFAIFWIVHSKQTHSVQKVVMNQTLPFHISRWDVTAEECEEHDWLLGWRGLIPNSSDSIAGTVEPGTCSWVTICWHWMESNWDSISSCWFLFPLQSFFDEIFAYANKPATSMEDFRRYLIAEPIGDLSSDFLVNGSGCPCSGHRLDVLRKSWLWAKTQNTQKWRVDPAERIHPCRCRAKHA